MEETEGASDGGGTPKKPKDPEVYKTRRSTTKRLFTRTVNSVEQKIKSNASKNTMELLRENIEELMNQTLLNHTKYDAA